MRSSHLGGLHRWRRRDRASWLVLRIGTKVDARVSGRVDARAGKNAGGRTGLTAVTVAALFLLALFFEPLAATVPSYATAPALLFVACLMTRALADIDWDDATEYAPAVVTAIAMPLTYSISNGIGFGFICYAVVKLGTGQYSKTGLAVLLIAAAFAIKYAYW